MSAKITILEKELELAKIQAKEEKQAEAKKKEQQSIGNVIGFIFIVGIAFFALKLMGVL